MFAQKHGAYTLIGFLQAVERCANYEPIRCFASASTSQRDHYQTLGIARSATPKQIKKAFYALSKKYHPDLHVGEEAKNAATEKFQEVVSAYEVLGSAEKKREYDLTFSKDPLSIFVTKNKGPDLNGNLRKSYLDPDVEYKTFEHFQRSMRRRRVRRHDFFQMPDEFYAEFGGREFSSTYRGRWPSDTVASNFSDERTARREAEERRRWREGEEKGKGISGLPNFEEEKTSYFREKNFQEFKNSIQALFIMIGVSLIALVLQRG